MERLSSRGVLESAHGLQIDRASRGAVGIVLAGGKSRRLGQDKALLRVDGNIPLVVLAAERLREVVGEVIVVGDDGGRLSSLPFRVVSDRYPGAGPLGGIYSGLLAVEPARALVVAGARRF